MQCALSHCQNNWYDNRNFLLFEKKQGEKNGSLAQCMGESLMLAGSTWLAVALARMQGPALDDCGGGDGDGVRGHRGGQRGEGGDGEHRRPGSVAEGGDGEHRRPGAVLVLPLAILALNGVIRAHCMNT